MMYVYRALGVWTSLPQLACSDLSLSASVSSLFVTCHVCYSFSHQKMPCSFHSHLTSCPLRLYCGDLKVGTSSGGPHLARRKYTLILISLAYFWSLILLDSNIFCVFIECKGIQFYLCVHCCLQSGECLESSSVQYVLKEDFRFPAVQMR